MNKSFNQSDFNTSSFVQTAGQDTLWRDIRDPRKAKEVDDLEDGLKEPEFENISIPEQFGPVCMIIDDHKIKRFAFEMNDYLGWAMGAEMSPFDNKRIAHACLMTNDIVQLFTLAYKGSKVVGLHTEAQMWFDHPVHLNEIVTLRGEYTDAYVKRGQGCVVLDAEASGADGRTFVRYQGIEILKTIPGAIVGRSTASPEKRVTGKLPENPHYIRNAENIKVGDVLQPLDKTITAEQAAVFSRVGDFVTNIHNNLDTARKGGLKLPIVQGAQLFCCFGDLLTQIFGAPFFTGGWLRIKFISPISVFQAFYVSGIVTDIVIQPDGRKKIELDIWIKSKDEDKMSAAGWASCIID